MIRFVIYIALFFSSYAVSGVEEFITRDREPSWVEPCPVDVEHLDINSSQATVDLLNDKQLHCEKKCYYFHKACKIQQKSGIDAFSKFEIGFRPDYEKIVFHKLRILREGRWIDCLKSLNFKIIQKEEGLDSNIYSGNRTALFFVEDLRIGDVLEWAFSLQGDHPLFSEFASFNIALQSRSMIERLYRRVIASKGMVWKKLCTSVDPVIREYSQDESEWIWDCKKPTTWNPEERMPKWFVSQPRVLFSSYENWGLVAKQMAPLFALKEDFSQSMVDLVALWKATTDTPLERALQALRFVQDEIGYLGNHEGVGTHRPAPPEEVFQKRVGDCKDKCLLLHALLKLMDISSTPILVNAHTGAVLPEQLPSPFAFDHAILLISIEGKEYWAETTEYLEGGKRLGENFPNYHWGLPMSEEAAGLIELPTLEPSVSIEYESVYELSHSGELFLELQCRYYGLEGDQKRKFLTLNGREAFSRSVHNFLKSVFGEVVFTEPLSIEDDRPGNVVTCKQQMQVFPSQGDKRLEIPSFSLLDHFKNDINPSREAPYSIPYPVIIKENIHIKGDFPKVLYANTEYTLEHPSVVFSKKTNITNNQAAFAIALRSLKDHVAPSEMRDYRLFSKELKRQELIALNLKPVSESWFSWRSFGPGVLFGSLVMYALKRLRRRKRAGDSR